MAVNLEFDSTDEWSVVKATQIGHVLEPHTHNLMCIQVASETREKPLLSSRFR